MKTIKILLTILLILPIAITRINAEEIETKGVIYCERYKGKHEMYYYGYGDIYDEGGDNLRKKGFRFYKCTCGHVVFSNNRPESNNNIPGTYIETDKSKENLYDGYIVYSKNKIGTNLPMRTKNTSMISCDFHA